MSLGTLQPYLLAAAVVGFMIFRFLRFRAAAARLPELRGRGAIILDVRSPAEYRRASAPGSVNIPLDQLERRLGELDASKPVVVCCASGTRSALAAATLKRRGFREVLNAGPWTNAAS